MNNINYIERLAQNLYATTVWVFTKSVAMTGTLSPSDKAKITLVWIKILFIIEWAMAYPGRVLILYEAFNQLVD